MGAVTVRLCASVMVATIFLAPVVIPEPTVAWKEKTLSPAVASPCVPSSKNGCDRAPPMLVRSATTARPELGGVVAGVTRTVSKVLLAGSSEDGEATPRPDGWDGSPPQEFAGAALLRGIGPMVTKSLALLSVSMQPLPLRTAAVVLVRDGVGVVSEQFAVP